MKHALTYVASLWLCAHAALGMDLPAGYYVGAIPFRYPAGIVCTSSGAVYVLRDRKTADGGGLYQIEGAGAKRIVPFDHPTGLLYHEGKFWVTEPYAGDLYVVDPKTLSKRKHVDEFLTPGWPDKDDDPHGLAAAPAGFAGDHVKPGDLIIVDRGFTGKTKAAWWIHTVDPETPGKHQTLAANPSEKFSGTLFEPAAIAAGLDGSVYVAEARLQKNAPSQAAIFKVSPSGQLTRFCADPRFKAIEALAVNPNTGMLYASDEHAGHIFEIDPGTGQTRIFVGKISAPRKKLGSGVALTSLAWSPDGKTLYAGWGSRVLVFTTNPRALPASSVLPDLKAAVRAIPFPKPSGLAFDAKGVFYLARRNAVKAGGGVYSIANCEVSARLAPISMPADLVFAPDGSLLVCQDYEGHLSRVNARGGKPTILVRGGPGWPGGDPDDDPIALAFAPTGFKGPNVKPGDLLVLDVGALGGGKRPDANWVYTVHLDASPKVHVLRADADGKKPRPMGAPRDLAVTPDGRVFIADPRGDGHIWKLKPDGKIAELHTVDRQAKRVFLRDAQAIACRLSTGMLYVADGYTDEVFRVNPKTGLTEPALAGFMDLGGGSTSVLGWNADGTVLCVGDWGAGVVYQFTFSQ